jgi:hypothetical protein
MTGGGMEAKARNKNFLWGKQPEGSGIEAEVHPAESEAVGRDAFRSTIRGRERIFRGIIMKMGNDPAKRCGPLSFGIPGEVGWFA